MQNHDPGRKHHNIHIIQNAKSRKGGAEIEVLQKQYIYRIMKIETVCKCCNGSGQVQILSLRSGFKADR